MSCYALLRHLLPAQVGCFSFLAIFWRVRASENRFYKSSINFLLLFTKLYWYQGLQISTYLLDDFQGTLAKVTYYTLAGMAKQACRYVDEMETQSFETCIL